jgi:hypothetical protein
VQDWIECQPQQLLLVASTPEGRSEEKVGEGEEEVSHIGKGWSQLDGTATELSPSSAGAADLQKL